MSENSSTTHPTKVAKSAGGHDFCKQTKKNHKLCKSSALKLSKQIRIEHGHRHKKKDHKFSHDENNLRSEPSEM